MKEISITAATFHGNKGAEAMLSTTIGMLRQAHPDLKFNIYSYYYKIDSDLVDDKNIQFYNSSPLYLVFVLNPCALLYFIFGLLRLTILQRCLPQSVQAIARSKAMICLAGVSFVAGRTKFLPFNIATILPAIMIKTPVVKFSQALGGFDNFFERLVAKLFLKKCHRIFARGDITYQNLRGLLGEESSNITRANDIAFLFDPSFAISKGDQEVFETQMKRLKNERHKQSVVVGICPSSVIDKKAKKQGWDYSCLIENIVRELSQAGYTVILFPNAVRSPDPNLTHNNDLPLINRVYDRLELEMRKNIFLFSGLLNVEQIHHIISYCDVAVVSRFHAMVGALALKIPVAVMGWSHKYLEVMTLFNQQDMVIDYKDNAANKLIEDIENLIQEKETRTKQIENSLGAVQKLSNIQLDYILSLINTGEKDE